ncbi:MAG: DUF4268 domain-containing protein [Anaerolineales bacterium]|nr:DUF4268 domain-containing protein [Anaerolineales bacterium]
MNVKPLAHLRKVDDLRQIWPSESGNFTPWLAQEENLALLADTIGLELELEAQEKHVGPFRADIVCKNIDDESWVLIENQLERTDHSHLGQLLTYAAGLNAVTIVWISERFTDEHRAALDWLNEVTDEHINMFGLEIELWQIADSPIAPKFNIISKPNDWTKLVASARRQAEAGDISETKQMQLEYWTAFKNHLENNNSFIRSQTPKPRHWMNFSIGRSGFRLCTLVNTRDETIGVQLLITKGNIEAFYHLLLEQREAIEKEVGETMSWEELPNKKRSQVNLVKPNTDPLNEKDWPHQHQWLQTRLEALHRAFSGRVKALDESDYEQTVESAVDLVAESDTAVLE